MSKIVRSPDPEEPVEVNLKDPWLAAFLAWLWPGAGHLYQGRTGKGWLYMIAILSTFVFGLVISGGHAVYASFTSEDFRYPYICQFPVGLPALPAVLQDAIVSGGGQPVLGGFMAPPNLKGAEMVDELSVWNKEYNFFFELGTVYTMIAGLLNVLAIYDAYGGPLLVASEEEDDEAEKQKQKAAVTT
jgi:hypothetical protein